MKRLVIFDLDGTLLETIGDLGAACNAVLARHGLPQHDDTAYRHFVGNGVRKLIERALPDTERTPERIETLLTEFMTYYTAHIADCSRPYEGIEELLRTLHRRGVGLAVVSNKFQQGTTLLIEHFFPQIPFVAIFGQRPDLPLKPDPAADQAVLQIAGVAPEEALHLGDTSTDMTAARAAGITPVGVSWGFRSPEELQAAGAERIIQHPKELLEFFNFQKL